MQDYIIHILYLYLTLLSEERQVGQILFSCIMIGSLLILGKY
jgi:hypothetical protein